MVKKFKIVPSSVFVMILSLLFLAQTFSIVKTNQGLSVGPASFPQIACIALLVLAVLDEIKVNRAKELKEKETVQSSLYVKLILSIFVFAVCAFLLKIIGFLILGFIFMFAQILLASEKIEKKDVIKALLISFLVTVIAFIIFNYGFKLRVPVGILKF